MAHVIADFPLQFTGIYRLKTEYHLGSLLHSGVFSFLSLLLLWPYWNLARIWEFVLFLWMIHGIQDGLKVRIFEKYHIDNIWIFLIDQTLHIGFLGMLFSFGLGRLTPPEALSRVVSLYNDNNVVVYGIAFVSGGFGGGILASYIKTLFYGPGKVGSTSPKKYGQVLERVLIMGLMLLKGYYYLAVPGVWMIHIGYANLDRGKDEPIRLSSLFDLILNTSIALLVVLILKRY